jgi:hypothetical protein
MTAENFGCLRTYSTLRVYTGEQSPDLVSERLSVEPTRVWYKGATDTVVPRKRNGWFLSTRGQLESLDTALHLSWLLERIQAHRQFLAEIVALGGEIDIVSFWHAAGTPEGGPALQPGLMSELAELQIPISWNIYTG